MGRVAPVKDYIILSNLGQYNFIMMYSAIGKIESTVVVDDNEVI